ncbi:MAG: HAD-IC family P-type ATPase [Clostridia bacterium]|nr:HAD-IC family P-type ATPase [Clostridia bacterium]
MSQQTSNNTNKTNIPQLEGVERFVAPVKVGLTAAQVEQRNSQGLTNVDNSKKGKSVLGILLSNIFTYFNMIYFIIALVLCLYGMPFECTFVFVVAANTVIAIVQEIKAKKTLDKLNIISEPRVKILRDGLADMHPVSEIVLDDIVLLSNGEQISSDCIVMDGFVEVNEAILTGESEAVVKRAGDTLFAGSFIVGGSCTARVSAVGKYNYIAGLTGRAKQYQKPRSQMLRSLKAILIFVSIIVIPMTIGLFVLNAEGNNFTDWANFSIFDMTSESLRDAIKRTSGSIVSMIPAGPFLLTSVALAAAFLRLAKRKTMVQELYCIEMLARVDTLCLDKTGTITDGTMRVIDSIDLRSQSASTYTIREIVSSMNSALKADNMTSRALKQYFGSPKTPALEAVVTIPFSSERKLSAVSFKGHGTYMLGAPEFVLKTPNQRIADMVKKYAEQGYRVLLLAYSSSTLFDTKTLPQVRRPVAVIVIEDHIRPDAEETINWFKQNGVAIKVISGDNPTAVSNIAMRVGVENADKYISLEGMSDEEVMQAASQYTVFGRVSPDQKAILVKALRSNGKTVAMTGDGVNDILAMKEADCSISLAGGSDAARNVSHLILMDDSFSNLPSVVAEGRRVVNNIQRATSMYFMKTMYVIVLNAMLILLHYVFNISMLSPLSNTKVLLMDAIVVGLPTTLLALQPNESRIKGHFLVNVLKRCLPATLTFLVTTGVLYVLHVVDNSIVPDHLISTLITIVYTFGGMFALYYACKPFNNWKRALYLSIWVVLLVCLTVPALATSSFLGYDLLLVPCDQCGVDSHLEQLFLLIADTLAIPFVLAFFTKLFHYKKGDKLLN